MKDANPTPTYQTIVTPALLADARHTYRLAVRSALAKAGCEDMPRHGSFVVGGVVRNNSSVADIMRGLPLTKQAISQLVDVLVARQYLKRSEHPTDRRRMVLELTDRGYYAAGIIGEAVEGVDLQLQKRIGAEQVTTFRAALGALIELRND